MVLTQAERDKFIIYLRESMATDSQLIEQMVKIGAPSALIRDSRTMIFSKQIVANMLEKTETVTVTLEDAYGATGQD